MLVGRHLPPPDHWRFTLFDTHPWPSGQGCNTPIHEASHIVVGHLLGMPVFNALIAANGVAGRAGVFYEVSADSIETPPPPACDVVKIHRDIAGLVFPGMSFPEVALRIAAMLAAGRQGELLAAGATGLPGELRMHDPDHLQARELLLSTGQRLAMTWVQRQARHLLASHWSAVTGIAGHLRDCGCWSAVSSPSPGLPEPLEKFPCHPTDLPITEVGDQYPNHI